MPQEPQPSRLLPRRRTSIEGPALVHPHSFLHRTVNPDPILAAHTKPRSPGKGARAGRPSTNPDDITPAAQQLNARASP
jgi:hypothetical protein